jgi:hypothetical protein
MNANAVGCGQGDDAVKSSLTLLAPIDMRRDLGGRIVLQRLVQKGLQL